MKHHELTCRDRLRAWWLRAQLGVRQIWQMVRWIFRGGEYYAMLMERFAEETIDLNGRRQGAPPVWYQWNEFRRDRDADTWTHNANQTIGQPSDLEHDG